MQQRSSRYTRWLVPALAGALLLSAAACDDKISPTGNLVALIASNITVSTASNGQTGVVGQPLAQPIVVHVSDQNSAAIANAVVTWTVLTGGGSVSSATSLTDANGDASVTWTLGDAVGEQTLRASIANGASVTITATATEAVGATNVTSGNDHRLLAAAFSATAAWARRALEL